MFETESPYLDLQWRFRSKQYVLWDHIVDNTFLFFCSMTHCDITIGYAIAMDVHCDIMMGHVIIMSVYHDVTLHFLLVLGPSFIMYYYTQL